LVILPNLLAVNRPDTTLRAGGNDRANAIVATDGVLLEIRQLGMRFPARQGREPPPWVIQDLTFSVCEREFVTIIGPSGAGKSTLLNIIAQIDTASAGEIVFAGERVTCQDPRALRPGFDRRIGYVTQDDNLLPWRTTLENVLFPIEVQGRLDAKTRAHAEMLIRAVGLAGFEGYYPHELSGGMRKRAALIRTLVYDPPMILMDEPFGAVDAQTRTQLQADLLNLWHLGRKTIIFVTHDITEAIALGDRALVLSRAPAHIAAEHPIPIPRPRNVKDIFALEGFAAIYEKIRAKVQ
jgi:NitT/TauT family transport system ATP-binding protein